LMLRRNNRPSNQWLVKKLGQFLPRKYFSNGPEVE
jgi:hypothetical protein